MRSTERILRLSERSRVQVNALSYRGRKRHDTFSIRSILKSISLGRCVSMRRTLKWRLFCDWTIREPVKVEKLTESWKVQISSRKVPNPAHDVGLYISYCPLYIRVQKSSIWSTDQKSSLCVQSNAAAFNWTPSLSQTVSDLSTNRGLTFITGQIELDGVFSTLYGCKRHVSLFGSVH